MKTTGHTDRRGALNTLGARAIRALRSNRSAKRLADLAGAGQDGREASFESLEQRQLLFTLTVSPDSVDPNTGLGQARASWSYYVPYLVREVPADSGPVMPTIEEFADEMDFWTNAFPAIPPNGARFSQSNIRVSYRAQGGNAVELLNPLAVPGLPDGGANGAQDRDLGVRLSGTDFVQFEFTQGDQNNGGTITPRLTTNFAATIRSAPWPGSTDGDGIKTGDNGTRLELLRDGVVVRTITGAELAGSINAGGVLNVNFAAGFTAFRFSAADLTQVGTYTDNFIIDDIQTTFPSPRFASFVESGIFSAILDLRGPAGASVQVLDLYGREMVADVALGILEGRELPVIDANGDGIPDFNDGIGKIIVRNTNTASSLTLTGGNLNQDGDAIELPDGPGGINDDLEGAGFGFTTDGNNPPGAVGIPPSGASMVIGAPWIRNRASTNSYLANQPTPVAEAFQNPDQGIFVQGSIGSIVAHALLMGQSRIDGAVGRFNVSNLYGSLTVAGDVGYFGVAGDAGLWQAPPGQAADPNVRNTNPTNSQLVIGRTVREIAVGGRNGLNIQVLADINNANRAPINYLNYREREVTYQFDPATQDGPRITMGDTLNNGGQWNILNGNAIGQATYFGDAYFRNDSLLSAEYIGNTGTSTRLFGNLGGIDPINTGPDNADVFAFAADPSREIVAQVSLATLGNLLGGGYMRIVDRNGIPLAALDVGAAGRGENGNTGGLPVIRFRPDHADVYYLVLNAPNGNPGATAVYDITINGMAPTTIGAIRSGAGVGGADTMVLNLNAGSMGSLRVGTGVVDGDGTEIPANGYINTNQSADALGDFAASSISVPGTLYNITTGSDIDGATILVGRDLGTLVTGLSPVTGGNNLNGDLTSIDLRVGGRIGALDIRGGMGISQDPDTQTPDRRNQVVTIRTGTIGGRGDIGQILVGAYVSGSNVTITTSPGSIIDQFLVLDGPPTQFGPGEIWDGIPVIRTGVGSDVRFMDFALLQRAGDTDIRITLAYNQSYTFVDDGGASFTVRVTGGDTTATTSTVTIRSIPIDGSQGVAVGRINANLVGGANLVITAVGTSAGEAGSTISIGRLVVDTNGNAGSSIIINDAAGVQAEIDIGRIDITGPLNQISNLTIGRNNRNGDIVAIDAASLRSIQISGDLGRTQTSGAGERLLGPILGIAAGEGGSQLGGPILVDAAAVNSAEFGSEGDKWGNGNILAAIQGGYDDNENLETFGSPVDFTLNGVIVRAGDLESVEIQGAVGDVIVQDGHLLRLVANSDGIRPFGAFQGIVGNIYADVINQIDIGDGLLGTGSSPFAAAGIFANDDIISVNASRITNAVIRGVILAADIDNTPRTQIGTNANTTVDLPGGAFVGGIQSIGITRGDINNAMIASTTIDRWWVSGRGNDSHFNRGEVSRLNAVGTRLFRSEVLARTIGTVSIVGAAYDATLINAADRIDSVLADEFLNSTRETSIQEFHANIISVSNNLGVIATNGLAGDITDLQVVVLGTLTGRIAAFNIVRAGINIANTASEISAVQDFKSTGITAGRVVNFNAGRNVRSSQFNVSGPIDSLTASGEMTGLSIVSSGPDGRIGLLRANGRIVGDISSSGPISTIQSVNSDISGTIVTTDVDGDLATLQAGRDILVDMRLLGSAGTITAARNIGRASDLNDRALDIRTNLGSITVGGQIFSDVLVGENITGAITNGRVVSKPGNDSVGAGDITAFGRINSLVLNGDFNGNITSKSGGIGSITITNGSFRQGKTITALDGSIGTIIIKGGDLLGDIFTDGSIASLQILTGDDGFRGQIGVDRTKANSTSFDAFRNQLPPGTNATTGIDGPSIIAGQDLLSLTVQNGTVWEALIMAGRRIGSIAISGGFRNDQFTTAASSTFIVAGDRIDSVTASAMTDRVAILAGVYNLGADGVPGGVGENADAVHEGSIGTINFRGAINRNVRISAGVNAGADGLYNTTDDLVAPGVSNISTVSIRQAKVSSVYADGDIGSATGGSGLRVRENGSGMGLSDDSLYSDRTSGSVAITNGVTFFFTSPFNQRGSILFTGPGRAFYDSALNRIILQDTNEQSSLLVNGRKNGRDSVSANLRGLQILGNNNSSLGSLSIRAKLLGDARVFIDGDVGSLFSSRFMSGLIGAGGDVNNFTFAIFDAGTVLGRDVGTFRVNQNFGKLNVLNEASARFLNIGNLSIARAVAGSISSDQDIDVVSVGSMNGGGIRSGGTIGPVTSGSITQSAVSARDAIGAVTVTGNVTDSAIYAGVDLGRDANFGGSGFDADVISNGVLGNVTVSGNFPQSDIAAGVYRGTDGFLGTADDRAADGRSQIGAVTINGNTFGSSVNSEQYRIVSTGSVGNVTIDGSEFVSRGNFATRELGALPVPVVVTDLNVFEDSRVYRAEFSFNQPIDASTFGDAISIAEVRNGGATLVGLAQGTDYTVRYNPTTNIGSVTFSRNVTDRNLPQQPGVPGPGVFRFVLSGAIFRGASTGVMLDGNQDGTTGDDFSQDALVGDAGDKITSGNPGSNPSIDFYAATDLNLLLDSNYASDNNPDVNTDILVRGTIGDHPDHDIDFFRAGGDVDLYRITLRAGQILRLGRMQGVAVSATRAVYDATGTQLVSSSPANPQGGGNTSGSVLLRLPVVTNDDPATLGEDHFLVTRTGTYFIAISGDLTGVDIADVNNIPSSVAAGGGSGAYRFTVQVFDDGNTGFNGDNDSGDGSAVVNAPAPITFAGADGIFGSVDDIGVFATGRYTFRLDRGSDGVPNTADDVVTGNDGGEIVSTRRVGADRVWGTADDEVRSTVEGAIGLRGNAGLPDEITADSDVYRLNGGNVIAPGTRVRFTFRLTDTGSNIGLPPEEVTRGLQQTFDPRSDLLGDVQIALFELSANTGFSDANLVFSPSNFLPFGGQPAETITDGTNSYGYDAQGDFFMDVVLPGAQTVNGNNVPAAYAFYVQGAIRSDYTLEVLTQGTGTVAKSRQNILIETNGGVIDWLETSGIKTNLDAFSASVLGFSGQINGVDVDDYIIDSLVDSLNNIFVAANVDIVVSRDPADFEGQDFSTVFVAGNTEPSAFFNNSTFGASQKVDLLNIDKNDQAVVFLPSLSLLGFNPSNAGVNFLVQSLTAAVGRRVGELIGLRQVDGPTSAASPVEIMGETSIFFPPGPGGVFGFNNASTNLSDRSDTDFDTNFYLGNQNSLQLLQRIIRPRA